MKKFLLFFILILLFGCETIQNRGNETALINCPNVFFSLENNVYSQGDLDTINLENFNYKASLNNYGFKSNCFSDSEKNYYSLDVLILVEPINPKDNNINLPIFVILYDKQDQVADKQYFRINDYINYSEETSLFEITEVIGNLNIITNADIDTNSMIVGFVKIN